jgi:hypothetical protein
MTGLQVLGLVILVLIFIGVWGGVLRHLAHSQFEIAISYLLAILSVYGLVFIAVTLLAG